APYLSFGCFARARLRQARFLTGWFMWYFLLKHEFRNTHPPDSIQRNEIRNDLTESATIPERRRAHWSQAHRTSFNCAPSIACPPDAGSYPGAFVCALITVRHEQSNKTLTTLFSRPGRGLPACRYAPQGKTNPSRPGAVFRSRPAQTGPARYPAGSREDG